MKDIDFIRLEYKLDLVIAALQGQGLMLPAGETPQLYEISEDYCPICNKPISLKANFSTEELVRVCGCKLPINIVSGISALTRTKEEHNAHRRTGEERVSPDSAEEGAGDGGREDPAGPGGGQVG